MTQDPTNNAFQKPGGDANSSPPLSFDEAAGPTLPHAAAVDWNQLDRALADPPQPPPVGQVPATGVLALPPSDVDPGSRELVLAWCLWLLGSWCATLLLTSGKPTVHLMMYACLTGMMLLWPALRLSQGYTARRGLTRWVGGSPDETREDPHRPPPADRPGPAVRLARVFRDWISLYLVFQAVIWPLVITAEWSLAQTLWLDAAVGAWSLLTAAFIGWGALSGRGALRCLAMAFCVLLVVGEPLLEAVMVTLSNATITPWSMRISPVSTIEGLTQSPVDWQPYPWAWHVISAAVAAALAWLTLIILVRRRTQPGIFATDEHR
ncbi:MAG: hypothetical protein WD042_07860 [Phycisphaeraceae bacterium]